MYSDDEGYQQHSQYSKHRSRRSSGSAERDSETRRRSRSRSHIPIERPPRQPRSRDYRLRPTSTSPSREYAQYPPSIVPEGHVPRGLPFKYSAARMTQRQLDMEDKEMRREDDLNRRRQDEAKGNKRLEESRSRSRRRSYGAFSRPQQYSGEGEIPDGERYHYRQPRRSPAPSGSSKGGYHGDVSGVSNYTMISSPCLTIHRLNKSKNLGLREGLTAPKGFPLGIDTTDPLEGGLEMMGHTILHRP
jgi:hypothetical protein